MTLQLERLVIVRHGTSVWNDAMFRVRKVHCLSYWEKLRKTEEAEWPLSHVGEQQVARLAAWMAEQGLQFDACFHSPYKRAMQTAIPLQVQQEWQEAHALRERNWGRDMHEPTECIVTLQNTYERLAHRARTEWHAPMPNGGESLASRAEELRGWFKWLEYEYRGGSVLCVGHGELGMLIRHILGGHSHHEWEHHWKDPKRVLGNTQVVTYSSRHPQTGQLHTSLRWVKSENPNDDRHCHGWEELGTPFAVSH